MRRSIITFSFEGNNFELARESAIESARVSKCFAQNRFVLCFNNPNGFYKTWRKSRGLTRTVEAFLLFLFFFFFFSPRCRTVFFGFETDGSENPRIGIESPRVRNDFHSGRCIRIERGTFVDFPRRKRRRFVRKHLVSRGLALHTSNCPHFSLVVVPFFLRFVHRKRSSNNPAWISARMRVE